MKILFRALLFLVLVNTLGINLVLAQDDSELSEYLPSLATDDPSSLYNGIPDISIPLLSLKGRGITLPVTLTYDASGLTVQQDYTNVGMGWTLSAGGHIVYETNDLADIDGFDRLSYEQFKIEFPSWNDDHYGSNINWVVLYENGTNRRAPAVYDPDTMQNWYPYPRWDLEPDVFYYSCNGLSGRFILDTDLSTGVDIPKSNLIIKRDADSEYLTVTDASGIIYGFQPKHTFINPSSRRFGWYNSFAIDKKSIVYMMDKVYTPEGDTIEFEYYVDNYSRSVFSCDKNTLFDDEYSLVATSVIAPNYPVKKISLVGGASIEFELGDGILEGGGLSELIKVKLIDANGERRKFYELYYDEVSSDPYYGYLPCGYYDMQNNLHGEYNIRNNSGSLEHYDVIKVAPSVINVESSVIGLRNGVWETVENCFSRGAYLFQRHNDTLFAVLNSTYVNSSGGFHSQYKTDFLNGVGTYYFLVDEANMNEQITEFINGQENKFRPMYKSHTNKRLFLDRIIEFSEDSLQSLPAYFFEYNQTKLGHSMTRDFDHWGYYNYREGKPNKSPVLDIGFPNFPTSIFEDFGIYETEGPIYDGYKKANQDKMKAGVLEKITFPNGGSIHYTYESNLAIKYHNTPAIGVTVGGLRVASKEINDGEDNILKTRYKYNQYNETDISGVKTLAETNLHSGYLLTDDIRYASTSKFIQVLNYLYPIPEPSIYSLMPLKKTRSGYVGYSNVAVVQEDDSGYDIGTTVYKFYANSPQSYVAMRIEDEGANCTDCASFFSYLKFPLPEDAMLGSLLATIKADANNRILQKTENEYCELMPNNNSFGQVDHAIYNKAFRYDPPFPGIPYHFPYNFECVLDPNRPLFEGDIIYLAESVPKLSEVKTTNFFPDQGTSLVNVSYFLYDYPGFFTERDDWEVVDGVDTPELPVIVNEFTLDAHRANPASSEYDYSYTYPGFNSQQLIQSLEFKSNGDQIRTRYWYPPQLADSDLNFEEMTARNIISTPVKSVKLVNGTLREGQYSEYDGFSKNGSTNDDYFRPTKVYSLYGSNYELDKEFLDYDSYGLPTEFIDRSGITSSVIYGYNNTLPISQITNATSSQVFIDGFDNTNLESWTGIGNGDGDTQWSVESGHLRLTNYASAYSGECDRLWAASKSEITSNMVFEFDVQVEDSDNWNLTIGMGGDQWGTGNGGAENAIWSAINNESWSYYSGSWATIKSGLSIGETYHFKIVVKPSLSKVDFYVDDELCIQNGNFRSPSSGIQKVAFGNYGYDTTKDVTWLIDNVRLYPEDAQVLTYTYDPIIGKTSETDPNGQTTYYEFDSFGRIIQTLDSDKNVIKKTEYNYANQ